MPYCPKCGFQVSEDMGFCPQCGACIEDVVYRFKTSANFGTSSTYATFREVLEDKARHLIMSVFVTLFVLLRLIPLVIVLMRGVPLQLNLYTSREVVFAIVVIIVLFAVVAWWSRERFWLDEPLDKRSFPKTINVVLLTLGALLFGFVFGINFYADTWGFNNVIFVPSRDLDVNSAGEPIYELILGMGIILFLIGYLNMCIKGNRRPS